MNGVCGVGAKCAEGYRTLKRATRGGCGTRASRFSGFHNAPEQSRTMIRSSPNQASTGVNSTATSVTFKILLGKQIYIHISADHLKSMQVSHDLKSDHKT